MRTKKWKADCFILLWQCYVRTDSRSHIQKWFMTAFELRWLHSTCIVSSDTIRHCLLDSQPAKFYFIWNVTYFAIYRSTQSLCFNSHQIIQIFIMFKFMFVHPFPSESHAFRDILQAVALIDGSDERLNSSSILGSILLGTCSVYESVYRKHDK